MIVPNMELNLSVQARMPRPVRARSLTSNRRKLEELWDLAYALLDEKSRAWVVLEEIFGQHKSVK